MNAVYDGPDQVLPDTRDYRRRTDISEMQAWLTCNADLRVTSPTYRTLAARLTIRRLP